MTKARDLSVVPNQSLGFKNRIINGGMMIDQRNNGASITPTSGQFSVDRWKMVLSQSSKYTAQQNAGSVTPPAGFRNYLGITSTSAYSVLSSDYFFISQGIEGFNMADLNWGTANAQTVTLSFWVRSSLTGTFGGVIGNVNADRSYPFSYTISSANTWEQKSVTIAGDTTGTWNTTNGAGAFLYFNLGSGSSFLGTAGAWSGSNLFAPTGATSVVGTNGATWYVTGVQLERGSTATSFDTRSYGTELQLCQRYFTVFGRNANLGAVPMVNLTTEVASARWFFPVLMRTTPSCTLVGTRNTDYGLYFSGTYRTLGNSSVSDITPDSVRFDMVASPAVLTSGGASGFYFLTTTGAITASAEL